MFLFFFFEQTVVILMFIGMLAAGAYGCMLVRDGLDLTDLVPKNSTEHKFVTAQYKYFSFHSIFAVTMKDFDYSKGQKLIYKYHSAFKRVSTGRLIHIMWVAYNMEKITHVVAVPGCCLCCSFVVVLRHCSF